MKLVTECLLLLSISSMNLSCSPELGSEKWCIQLKEKPRGEWTVNEVGDYTKHCLFK